MTKISIVEHGPRLHGVLEASPTGTPGRFLLRIISAGEGSSGYYPPETLQLAATDNLFKAGTHCYLDHAAAIARGVNGERSVRDLAAVLAEDARYDEATESLVAEATVFGMDADRLREIAPFIGMSISASALIGPPMQGQRKQTITRIVAVESVDFVVAAGRGGAILQILESAAAEAAMHDRLDQLERAVEQAYQDTSQDRYVGVRDFDETNRLVWYYVSGLGLWQESWTPTPDDQTVTLDGNRTEVRAVTTYVPVSSDGATTTPTQEAVMPEISEARLAELNEAVKQVDTLTSERDAALKRAEEAEQSVTQFHHQQKVTETRQQATDRIAKALEGEQPALVQRVTRQIVPTIEADMPADLDKQVTDAVEAEKAYLKSLTDGRLTGFGPSTDTTGHTSAGAKHTIWN